jgi:hypothetical protein
MAEFPLAQVHSRSLRSARSARYSPIIRDLIPVTQATKGKLRPEAAAKAARIGGQTHLRMYNPVNEGE